MQAETANLFWPILRRGGVEEVDPRSTSSAGSCVASGSTWQLSKQSPDKIYFKSSGQERPPHMGRSVHLLKHGVGEAARWIVHAYACPDLAGGERHHACVDGGEFLHYRCEFDLKVAGSQRLVSSGCAKAQIA